MSTGFWAPFADLFRAYEIAPSYWKYIGAFLGMLMLVSFIEGYNADYAWILVAILLGGVWLTRMGKR